MLNEAGFENTSGQNNIIITQQTTMLQRWLNHNKDIGILLLRLFIGLRLIYGVQDNILSWEHMLRFRDFLQQFGFPFPMVCALVSVYVQFIAGLMIMLGWKIRIAATLVIINFLVAIIMVHRNDTVEAMTPALAILFCCILFLFQGAGKYSIDQPSKSSAAGGRLAGTQS